LFCICADPTAAFDKLTTQLWLNKEINGMYIW